MKLYGAIDLHSNNNVTVLIDEQDQVVYQKRLPNELPLITEQLSGYRDRLQGIVVESTYNWYWLVDGLMEHGHRVHLANTLEAPSSNGEAPDQKRRGQRKTTQPAASNRLMGLLRRYTRVRIHPNRVLLRPAPMSSSHCFALAKRSCGMRLADTTGSG